MATARSITGNHARREFASAAGLARADAPRTAESCPVLARIPDVGRATTERHTADQPAASSVPTYRFDLPETAHPHQADDSAAVARPVAAGVSGRTFGVTDSLPEATGLPLWASPTEVLTDLRPTAAASPAEQLIEGIKPVVRFLMLVALFAAAGLSIRLLESPDKPGHSLTDQPPAPASGHAVIVPIMAEPPFTAELVPAEANSAEALLEPLFAAEDDEPALSPSPTSSETAADETSPTESFDSSEQFAGGATSEAAIDEAVVEYPTTNYPSPELPAADGPALVAPGAQRLPAVARLPGYVSPAPGDQDHHEGHESSIH